MILASQVDIFRDDLVLKISIGIEELWLNQINDSCKTSTKKVLIGNKLDLSQVSVLFERRSILIFGRTEKS